jgi:hypothetical protein
VWSLLLNLSELSLSALLLDFAPASVSEELLAADVSDPEPLLDVGAAVEPPPVETLEPESWASPSVGSVNMLTTAIAAMYLVVFIIHSSL